MRRSFGLALATIVLVASASSGATENVVTKVTARADGGRTVIMVRGSATPSFTAYRLERPARVVVDVADGKLGAEDLRSVRSTSTPGPSGKSRWRNTATRRAAWRG